MAVRYGYEPLKMDSHCDGSGATNSLDHALNCAVGGLVVRRHNEVLDVLCDLSAMAWGESAVRKEVWIVEPEEEGTGQKGCWPTWWCEGCGSGKRTRRLTFA
mmetsp:Transcript_9536/g.27473  ORF Transcript_9536/g.27473 Transcript_9536/m.27473 type:complete len:102 (+) Transcript_9536:1024-1329(+)